MDNAICLGGKVIYADKGYWRIDGNATTLYPCLREEACLGGYSDTNIHPINWDSGYEDVLWGKWGIVDGEKYENVGAYEWAKCPDPALNIVRLIGLMLLVIIFIIVLIIFQLRKRNESQKSILMKILANYLQVLTTIMSFDIDYPDSLGEIFSPASRISSSSSPFVSFDCFVKGQDLTLFTPSPTFLKDFLSGILPIFLFFVSLVVWTILYFTKHDWFKNFKRNLIVTNVVTLFMLHPNLTSNFLTVFE